MKIIKKNLALIVSTMLFAALVLANSVGVFAAAVPPTPDPTQCVDCQDFQDQLDGAYIQLGEIIGESELFRTQMETLLDQATVNVYANDVALMVDNLDNEVIAGHLLRGTACQDESAPFAFYSAFAYEGQTYCLENEDMWYGTDPNFFNFFDHMMYLNEFWDPDSIAEWQLLWDDWIEVLMDHDGGGEPGIIELTDLIIQLISDLADCEVALCPVIVCPDCEVIAADLDTALDDLDLLELEADLLDAELNDLEDLIDSVLGQLEEWAALKAEFEALVEAAGGRHGADCDGFTVGSGQAWGIAHNFGDVEWCFTNEGQIEDFIQNLEDYWANNSSSHLPTQAVLNQQLDDILNDYFDALADLEAVLADIDAQNDLIDGLIADLDDCLDELEALQDQGECLDQDSIAMRELIAEASGKKGFTPTPPAGEEPPVDETIPGNLEDIIEHWAEQYIRDLFDTGVVNGDGETGLFRPNDELNRAEAAKMLLLANEDLEADSFFDIFIDVTEDTWFWPFVNATSEAGYFEGYADGSFGPGNSILRAEAIAVVLRALGFEVPVYDTYSFPDLTGDEWFADLAEKAYQCGLVSGREGNLEGGDTITRAEFSKIVNLAMFEDLDEWECNDYSGCPVCEEGDTECLAVLADLQAVDACLVE